MKHRDECAERPVGAIHASAAASGRSPYGHACALREIAGKLAESNEDRTALVDAAHCIERLLNENGALHQSTHHATQQVERLSRRLDFAKFALTATE